MPKAKEKPAPEQFAFRVKPKHQAQVRGIEYNEGQTVMMTNEEFNLLASEHPECHSRLVPDAEFEPFMAQFNAGQIDHVGNTIPPAPEAEGQTEAGPVPSVEESDHVQ